MRIIETKRIWSCEIRMVCIEENWYTLGTNEEYTEMLNNCNGMEYTKKRLFKIAKNIYEHSEFYGYEGYEKYDILENIMFILAKKCITTTFQIMEV